MGGTQGIGVSRHWSIGIMGYGGVGVCNVWKVMLVCEFTRNEGRKKKEGTKVKRGRKERRSKKE